MVFNDTLNNISVYQVAQFYWWSHGSWMDSYLCNQGPSPQKLWVRILLMQHILDVILYHNSRWFSPASPVFSTNKIDSQDKAEILLKVELNTITLTHIRTYNIYKCIFELLQFGRGRQGLILMEVGFILTYALIVIHCLCCEFDFHTWWDVPDVFYIMKQS